MEKEKREKRKIRIVSRNSKLALVQSEEIKNRLKNEYEIEIVEVSQSIGDSNQNDELYKMPQIGVFTKQVEIELINGRGDVAVHSLKDLPTVIDPILFIAAVPTLQNRADIIIFNEKHKKSGFKQLDQLPPNSIIGSSSLRRISCLNYFYPQFVYKNIRGNIQTRLNKLQQQDYDCIILAEAGINRLGLQDLIDIRLEESKFGYAPGQGALGVQCRKEEKELIEELQKIENKESRYIVDQERLLLNVLEGGCKLPLAVYSSIQGNRYSLQAMLWSADRTSSIKEKEEGILFEDQEVGSRLAIKIKQNGGVSHLIIQQP